MFFNLKNLYSKQNHHFPLLIAFLLPFGINTSIIIAAWVICFFCFQNLKHDFISIIKNKWSYVLIGFFLIHAMGYFFSINKPDALTSIEIKLSFWIFPLLFFSSKYDELQLKKICISFVSACFLACLACLFRASYLYFIEGNNAFFYSEFTYFMHPSYLAMYLIFAELIVILYYKNWLNHLKHTEFKIGFISIIFLVSIFLCSSKMGLITAFLLIPFTVAIVFIKKGYKKAIIVMAISFVAGLLLTYKFFPQPFERLKVAASVTSSPKSIDKSAVESTAVRILIWEESIKMIKENILYGITPGDTEDRLCKAYQENGLTGALAKKLNTHNQFLQTFLGTGIIGLILLCIMTIYLLMFAILKRRFLLGLFSCLILLNFLVESMLQTQAGTVFYVFFLCFLLQYDLGKFALPHTLNKPKL